MCYLAPTAVAITMQRDNLQRKSFDFSLFPHNDRAWQFVGFCRFPPSCRGAFAGQDVDRNSISGN
jgi:hypothetical protein